MNLPAGFEVVTQEVAEQAEYAVCLRMGSATPFTDNVTGTCAPCGHAIFFRPSLPRRPTRICLECCEDMLRGGGA